MTSVSPRPSPFLTGDLVTLLRRVDRTRIFPTTYVAVLGRHLPERIGTHRRLAQLLKLKLNYCLLLSRVCRKIRARTLIRVHIQQHIYNKRVIF